MNRLLIKISGEALTADDDTLFNYNAIDAIADNLLRLQAKGISIAVVCGAGNIRRHRDNLNAGIDRVKSDYLGMTATIMNAVVLNERFMQKGGHGIVATPRGFSVPSLTKTYNALTMRDRMKEGKVIFCAGGTGNPYSTTDLAAVLRGLELKCDIVIKATTVDGIYDRDPHQYPDAKKFQTLSLENATKLGLSVMDYSAMGMARECGLPIFVCHMNMLGEISTDNFSFGTMVS